MTRWLSTPCAGDFAYSPTTLRKVWARLHALDCEPLPRQTDDLQAWVHFHNGDFEQAVAVGLAAGPSGVHAANRALCAYATHVAPDAGERTALYKACAQRCVDLQAQHPELPNAWYLEAHALGRYSQYVSVGLALAEGLGTRVRRALEHTLRLAPGHAEAHLALAAFHAEVIDKLGVLIGGLTYGANKEAGLHHYGQAMAMAPACVTTLLEYAQGLRMLEGERARPQVEVLMARAQATPPLDAWQKLELAAALRDL